MISTPTASPASRAQTPWPKRSYAWLVATVLMVLYIFSFIDRTVIALLVEPIKAEFGATDTQFGLLYGLAFSLFYTFLGIPIGLLADNYNRRNIIAVGVAVWGLATTLCGFAASFAQLFVARMMVGVGEATLSPAATSMLSDYFPPNLRAKALGVYSMGLFIGVGLAIFFGGMVIQAVSAMELVSLGPLGDIRTWQLLFIVVGVPGPFLAALMILVVREPKRRELGSGKIKAKTSFPEFLSFVKANANPLFNHYIGFSFLVLYAYSFTAWSPALFSRVFGMNSLEIGLYYGFTVLISAPAGILTGGWWAGAMRATGQTDANMRIGVYAAIGIGVFGAVFPLMPTFWLALVASGVTQFFIAMPFGAAPAALFDITPNRFRAQASAAYYFFINIIGLTSGPLLIGLLTDHVFADEMAVGHSMAIICALSSALGGAFLWFGLAGLRRCAASSGFTTEAALGEQPMS